MLAPLAAQEVRAEAELAFVGRREQQEELKTRLNERKLRRKRGEKRARRTKKSGSLSADEAKLEELEDKLEDPEFVDKMVRFVRASMKGWKWAEENPDEAAMIVLDNDNTGAQTEEHQKRMMAEVAKLTAGSNGALDPADFERTVESLLAGGSDPVITQHPGEAAWTHMITDKALN